MLSYLVSRYFPPGSFGRIYAIMVGVYGIGYGTAPIAAGAAFDITGSYTLVFLAILIATSMAALLIAALGKPPHFEQANAGADGLTEAIEN
jgi:MFS family permease